MGDVKIDLPNGSKRNTVILKDVVYAPDLAFTLISVTQLDMAKCSVLFKNSMCSISYPDRKTMATLPLSNGLYRLVAAKITDVSDHTNVASVKMSINEAHRKFGHIALAVIKHMVNTGMITGIELDPNTKPDFCEPCAKAKSNRKPFLKEREYNSRYRLWRTITLGPTGSCHGQKSSWELVCRCTFGRRYTRNEAPLPEGKKSDCNIL
jgi:hypothetical protein